MGQMNISSTLYNDTSEGVIAFAEQLRQQLINWNEYPNVIEELGQDRPNLQNNLNALFLSVYEKFLTFLNDADATSSAINTWKEIERFLADYADTDTLKGIVDQLNANIESRLSVVLENSTGSSTTNGMSQKAITDALGEKQDVIQDLSNIRSGVAKVGYYECSTQGSSADKAISADNYVLSTGGSMKVKMANANTADNATLNINNTGAKSLYYAGEIASSINSWKAGEIVEVYYDGTNFYANNVAGNNDGVVSFSEVQTLTSEEKAQALANVGISGIDAAPEANSTNLVKSGGVYDAIIDSVTFSTNQKVNTIGIDETPTIASSNLITSGGAAKVITDIMSDIYSPVELTELPYQFNSSTGKFENSSKRHCAIAVEEGEKYIVKGGGGLGYVFATSDAYEEEEEPIDIPFVQGTSIVITNDNDTFYPVTIPAGCTFLLVNKAASVNDVRKDNGNLYKAIDDAVNETIIFNSVKAVHAEASKGTTSSYTSEFTPLTQYENYIVKVVVDASTTINALGFTAGRNSSTAVYFVNKPLYCEAGKPYYFVFTAPVGGLDYIFFGSGSSIAADVTIYYIMKDAGTTITTLEDTVNSLDSAIDTKTISTGGSSGELVKYSDNSAYIVLPETLDIFAGTEYTVKITLGANISNNTSIYSTIGRSSTTKALFGTASVGQEDTILANTEITIVGTFPDNSRTHLYFQELGGESSIQLVSGSISTEGISFTILDVKTGNIQDKAVTRGKLSDDIGEAIDSISDITETIGTLIPDGTTKSLNPLSDTILSNITVKRDATTNLNVFTIAHISDTHGDNNRVDRFNAYCNDYNNIIDAKINTGDVVLGDFSDPFDSSKYTDTLIVIGNHDKKKYNEDDTEIIPSNLDVFERYIKDFSVGWGITLPADAETNGYCYFYKDYDAKKIRLIILDGNDNLSSNSTQLTWFQARLTEVLTSSEESYGYSVLVGIHYIPEQTTNFHIFNSAFSAYSTPTTANFTQAVNAVADFIDNGGDFIAWMVGHTHRDYIGWVEDVGGLNTKQVVLCVGAGGITGTNQECVRTEGEKSQDRFNVYSIDTTSKLIKLFRVGADYDMWGKHKVTACIDYGNAELLYGSA